MPDQPAGQGITREGIFLTFLGVNVVLGIGAYLVSATAHDVRVSDQQTAQQHQLMHAPDRVTQEDTRTLETDRYVEGGADIALAELTLSGIYFAFRYRQVRQPG